ncbi:hypothetical protein GCM10010252_77300 [Streptomyces aureoverticillatus]|nr:hypothetical protein GCM10010252_77300 [Streptomyces aureoverticillatus]
MPGWDVVSNGAPGGEAQAYAAALRAVLQPVFDQGVTQRSLATEVHVVASTVTRYLTGERIAPKEFVDQCAVFLSTHQVLLAPSELERLHGLRRAAQAASSSAEIRLLHTKEEIDQLKAALAAARLSHEKSTALAIREAVEQVRLEGSRQLAAIEQQLTTVRAELLAELASVQQELTAEQQRAQRLQAENNQLREPVRAQEGQLEHAREYVREMSAELAQKEEELARKKEELRFQQQQTKVLRAQVQQLSAAEEEAVSGSATQVNAGVATAQGIAGQTGSSSGDASDASASGSANGGGHTAPSDWAEPGDTVTFLRHLRQLRREADPSDDQLAVYDLHRELVDAILAYSSLPGLETVLALVAACSGNTVQWAADWHHVAQQTSSEPEPKERPLKDPNALGNPSTLWVLVGSLLSPAVPLLNITAFVALCRVDHGPSVAKLIFYGLVILLVTAITWMGLVGSTAVSSEDRLLLGDFNNVLLVMSIAAWPVAIIGPFLVEDFDTMGLWWAGILQMR